MKAFYALIKLKLKASCVAENKNKNKTNEDASTVLLEWMNEIKMNIDWATELLYEWMILENIVLL